MRIGPSTRNCSKSKCECHVVVYSQQRDRSTDTVNTLKNFIQFVFGVLGDAFQTIAVISLEHISARIDIAFLIVGTGVVPRWHRSSNLPRWMSYLPSLVNLCAHTHCCHLFSFSAFQLWEFCNEIEFNSRPRNLVFFLLFFLRRTSMRSWMTP